jgi:type IV pilus assembly protein PilY1
MSFLNRWGKNFALLCALALGCTQAQAEDIDIFIGNSTVDTGLPNVIFVLDNTSNWARQNQQWPGGLAQGQSEVRAIKTALADLEGKVNVGLVEYTTDGNANQDGGFVRFRLQELTDSSRSALGTTLDTIFNDINGPTEKRNSNTPYGNLMYDVYNYLAGGTQSYSGAGTNANNADESAYATNYSRFSSPLSADSACGKTYLIFIGNPNASGPSTDSSTNSAALAALYTAAGGTADGLAGTSGNPPPIALPGFSVVTETVPATKLGYSKACYTSGDADACSANEALTGGLCVGQENCVCDALDTSTTGGTPACVTGGNPADRTARFAVLAGGSSTTTVTETGTVDATKGRPWNFDDWAKFLNLHGVPITVTNEEGVSFEQRVPVITYTIDVFNKQQNADHSALMFSGSKAGGGRYFQAKSESAIVDAINTALSDILSVSSTFAAVTLPLSATNRAQSKNQVYIGMFRPDQTAKPRWFGNLKRYQVGIFDGEPGLADAQAKQAVNPLSGFAAECAESFWSSDSGAYWQSLGITPPPLSQCLGSIYSEWSDLPDGPFVEKGGTAQVSRKSDLTGRALLTVSGTALTSMTNSAAVGGDAVLDYLKGASVGVGEVAPESGGRPSIHGDVVHSRPLTINYGGTTGTYIYYGSNDGLYRSIRANTGAERWSLIAPEHYDNISRLYTNSPIVDFPNQTDVGAEPKDYFFDGSTGHVISYNENDVVDLAYIFPTMRRGGRMIYGLDVTDPTAPSLLWRLGCPSLASDTGCSTGFSDLGQTWSTPVSALLPGYSNSAAVLIFGGGYDNCLDADQTAYPCDSSAKGRGVYVLNAQTGALLAGPSQLQTDGPIVGDVSLVDFDQDGKPDFGYVADAKGGLWRLNFASAGDDGLVALAPAAWTITKVAAMSGNTRRFFNTPTVLALENAVYVALGSGNRERPLESNYPYQNDIDDRFYVFVDFPAASGSTVDLDGNALLNVTPGSGTACDARGARGWYTSLLGQGEQVVNPAAIAGGKVFFNTYRPGGASVGMCSRPLGVATGCAVDLFNPSACDLERCSEIAGGGMPIAPVITTVCVGCNAGRPDPNSENGDLIYDDPDHVDGSVVATVDNPDGSSGTKDVTICIGCKGLEPLPIEAAPPASRIRTYWNSDIDR